MPTEEATAALPPWKERLRLENKDLGTKIAALSRFIETAPEFQGSPPAIQCLMREQLKAMETYRNLLFARMTLLDVPVHV